MSENREKTRVAVYTGSFDPITLGHLNVIQRACQLVDRLVVGIGVNADKSSLFNPDERVSLVRRVTADLGNVDVHVFEGLAVRFVREIGARVMIRGIRPLTDLAGEITMLMANRQLDEDIETIFLMADSKLAHVSSSLIKQITPLADDEMLAKFLPRDIVPDVRQRVEGAR
jgi:pantetheine-phosphate adenylyltransferase